MTDPFVESGGSVTLGVVERDSFISSLTLRYGLFPDTELFASGSLSRSSSQTFAGANETASTTDIGFGDITLGLRKTVIHEALDVPDVIPTFKGDIPTGDGSISLGGGVALVKSFDPVVLFANVNYGHTFARDFSDTTPRKRESFDPQSGLTSLLASGFYIEPTVSFNLNGVGNDVVLGLSLPYTFQSGL